MHNHPSQIDPKKSARNYTTLRVVALAIFFSFGFFGKVDAAFVQSSTTLQTPAGVTSSIAFTNLTPGDTILISCSASVGGGNFQATSGNHIYFGSNASDTATLDSFKAGSTYLGQWIFRTTATQASTTYSCFNSMGLAGYVYMSATEFSETLTPLDAVASTSNGQITDATILASGAVGELAYMTHFQDYFAGQTLNPTDAQFVSSTDVEYTGQSKQLVYYAYRSDTFSVDTSVATWHYNDLGIANAVRYSVTGYAPGAQHFLEIFYPEDSTTRSFDFTDWRIHATNMAATSTWHTNLSVYWSDIVSSSLAFSTSTDVHEDPDIATRNLGHGTSTIYIHKGPRLESYKTYYAQVVDKSTGALSPVITFNSGNLLGTSNSGAGVETIPSHTNSTSSNTFFTNCQTLVDPQSATSVPAYTFITEYDASLFTFPFFSSTSLQFAVCHIIFPHSYTKQAAVSVFNDTLAIPPWNFFFDLSKVVSEAVSPTGEIQTTSTAAYERLTFNQNTTALGNNPITMMTSSSLASVIGDDGKTKWFEIYRELLYLVEGLFVIGLVWGRFTRR